MVIDFENLNVTKLRIANEMFKDMPYGITSIHIKNFNTKVLLCTDFMFANNKYLEHVSIDRLNTENLCSMKYMFRKCIALKTIDIKSTSTWRLVYIDSMFNECKNLESVDISSMLPDCSSLTDASYMFRMCMKLKNIDLSTMNIGNVASICRMFVDCESVFKHMNSGNIKLPKDEKSAELIRKQLKLDFNAWYDKVAN